MDLKVNLPPEFIFHELVTNVKGYPLAHFFEFLTLVKGDGRKDFKRIFLLDQGQLQMLAIGSHCSSIPVINHIFGKKYGAVILRTEWLELFEYAKEFLIDLFQL